MDGERRGDWEQGVNENLISLTAAQRVADRLVNDLQKNYKALDRVLRGDTDKDTDGIVARMHTLENQLNLARAEMRAMNSQMWDELRGLKNTVNGDAAGNPGQEQRIKELEGKRRDRQVNVGYFYHFITATAAGVLMMCSTLVLNWDRVEDFARSVWQHLHRNAVAAVAPAPKKTKHRKHKPIVVPEVSHDAPEPDAPE